MLDMIPREARRLGVDERRRLIGLLRAQVLAELGKAGGEPDACPRCGGTHLVRKGHDRDGSQRWSRRSCGRAPSRRPWAAPLRRPGGDSRLLPGRRHAPRRVAGRQAARVGGGDAPGAAALGGAVRELGMADAMRARPEGFLARLGGSRRGGSATTPAGSCGTSRRGGRTPTGRTPCRARRRRGATTTRGLPSRGSRSPSGPTGRISWPCRRWSNREF